MIEKNNYSKIILYIDKLLKRRLDNAKIIQRLLSEFEYEFLYDKFENLNGSYLDGEDFFDDLIKKGLMLWIK